MPSLRLPILALLSLLSTRALDAATNVYRNAVLADNPVAYWELDESSGTTAADSAPPAQNGTFQSVTLAQPSAFPVLGTAAGFNGSSSRVRVPANARGGCGCPCASSRGGACGGGCSVAGLRSVQCVFELLL